jgi:hypothetical protein
MACVMFRLSRRTRSNAASAERILAPVKVETSRPVSIMS